MRKISKHSFFILTMRLFLICNNLLITSTTDPKGCSCHIKVIYEWVAMCMQTTSNIKSVSSRYQLRSQK